MRITREIDRKSLDLSSRVSETEDYPGSVNQKANMWGRTISYSHSKGSFSFPLDCFISSDDYPAVRAYLLETYLNAWMFTLYRAGKDPLENMVLSNFNLVRGETDMWHLTGLFIQTDVVTQQFTEATPIASNRAGLAKKQVANYGFSDPEDEPERVSISSALINTVSGQDEGLSGLTKGLEGYLEGMFSISGQGQQ